MASWTDRRLAHLIALLLLCGGCLGAPALVAPADLVPLRRAGHPRGLLLRAADGSGVRLDPNTRLRFQRLDGRWTPWVRAGSLRVSTAGIALRHHVDTGQAVRARVQGLEPQSVEILRKTLPPGAVMTVGAGGVVEVTGRASIGPTLNAFARRLAVWLAPAYEHYREIHERCRQAADNDTWVRCSDEERAFIGGICHSESFLQETCRLWAPHEYPLRYLRGVLQGRPLGRWELALPGQGWLAPIDGRRLLGLLVMSSEDQQLAIAMPTLRLEDGLAWHEVRQAEVANVSGGRTLAAIVTTVAFSAVLLPIAAAPLGGQLVGRPGAGAAALPGGGPAGDAGAGEEAGSGGTLAGAVTRRPAVPRGAFLFSGGARRRALARVVAATEVTTDWLQLDGFSVGALGAVRFWEMFEVGAAARCLLSFRAPEAPDQQAAPGDPRPLAQIIGLAHLGLNLDLDARRRVAIPLSIQAGAGGLVAHQVKLGIGVRVRATDFLYLGLTPFNPTKTGAPRAPALHGWTFQSGLEVGGAF